MKLKGKCGKTISIVCCFLPKFANSGTLIPMAPFALLSAGMSAGIRDVTRYDKTFDAPFDSDAARWDWSQRNLVTARAKELSFPC